MTEKAEKIIDFHAHVFPDSMADKAMRVLNEEVDFMFEQVSDGTVAGLLANMDEWGISASVLLPIVTKQTQFIKVNTWTAEISSDKLIGFGSIFPHTDDYKRDIDFIVSLGLKGLKFHAEYQRFIVDDEHMLKIYDYALGKDLIIMHHGGLDDAFPGSANSTPRMFANVADEMMGGVIIASHMGGYLLWDDSEKYLAGKDIYMDTSMGFEYYPHDQFLRIVEKHGADKILFGSDAPWTNAKKEAEHLRSMPLPGSVIDAILYGNAERILGV